MMTDFLFRRRWNMVDLFSTGVGTALLAQGRWLAAVIVWLVAAIISTIGESQR